MQAPNLNRLYVHPLFFVAGFILHTALAVLFALYVAPVIATSVGIGVEMIAVYWVVFAIGVFLLALYRQNLLEGSVLAE